MWVCKLCSKPVYFAERRQSMGFDFHRECLKCQECGKILNPGQHAEHKETPYCHVPCYSALFGPKLFGHGSTVESHQSFGRRSGKSLARQLSELEKKIRDYNSFYALADSPSKHEITSREVNGRLVLEGVLRVFWGIEHSIRIKEFEDKRVIASPTKSQPPPSESDTPMAKDEVDLPKRFSRSYNRHSVHQFAKAHVPKKPAASTFVAEEETELYRIDQQEACQVPEESGPADFSGLTDSQIESRSFYLPLVDLSNCLDKQQDRRKSSNKNTSEVNLNKLDIKDANAIDAALKKYQTMPANFHPESLPKAFQLQRCEPLLNLSELTTSKPLSNGADEEQHKVSDDQPAAGVDDEELKTTQSANGPRALRRRPGKKFERRKKMLQRKSSFNGHWYDRDTSVFTPPKDSGMSVWITSLVGTQEVLKMLLDKYNIESEPDQFALYVVKDNGERRRLLDNEFPLLIRVNLGPHEDASRLYILDNRALEIRHEVAQFLKFSYAELRAILNMFYEEEEQEIAKIKKRYEAMKKIVSNHLEI